MRVKYVGHGITERAVEDIDFLKDESVDLAARLEQFVHHIKNVGGSSRPGGRWSWVEEECCRTLENAGYPTQAGYYRRCNGKWERHQRSDEMLLLRLKLWENPEPNISKVFDFVDPTDVPPYDPLSLIVEEETGTDSDHHFAALIIMCSHDVRLARFAGLHNALEEAAYCIGQITAYWKIKKAAGPVWELGNKVRTGGEKGATFQHGTVEEREHKRSKIKDLVDLGMAEGLTLTEARQQAAKKLRISYSTVRRAQSSH